MDNAVIDLSFNGSESGNTQDFVDNYSSKPVNSQKSNDETSKQQVFPNATDIGQVVANQVWLSGTEKAKQYATIYGNIDILRPYFDVEPRTVLVRLARAFVPVWQRSRHVDVPPELYGPSMLGFTLVALLLYSMKASSHTIQDGTLIGTAMGVCFGYWFFASTALFLGAYVANASLTFIQVLSLTGYALTAPCVIVFLSTVFHPIHDHIFFYALWIILGGLTAARMATAFASRAQEASHRLAMMSVSASVHMLFMLYLHFAYHSTVQQLHSITH